MFTITHDKSTVGFAVDADVFELADKSVAEIAALPTVTWESGMWFPTGATLGTLAAVQILDTLNSDDHHQGVDRLRTSGAVALGGVRSDWTIRTTRWFTCSHPGDYASLSGKAAS